MPLIRGSAPLPTGYGPVPPGPAMHDPRLLVECITRGRRDVGRRSVALAWQGSPALQRCNDRRRELGWDPLDPYEYEMFSDGVWFRQVPWWEDFPVTKHRARPRYTVPEGPWWYRVWVRWVVRLCG